MLECLPLNDIDPELQAVIPEVLQRLRLLLLQVVDDLREALLRDLLQQLCQFGLLIEGHVAVRIETEIVIIIIILILIIVVVVISTKGGGRGTCIMRLRVWPLILTAAIQLFISDKCIKVEALLEVLDQLFGLPLHVLSEAVNLGPRHIVRLAVSPNLLNIGENLLKVLILTALNVFL